MSVRKSKASSAFGRQKNTCFSGISVNIVGVDARYSGMIGLRTPRCEIRHRDAVAAAKCGRKCHTQTHMDIDKYSHHQQRRSDPVRLCMSASIIVRNTWIISETILHDQGGQGPGAVCWSGGGRCTSVHVTHLKRGRHHQYPIFDLATPGDQLTRSTTTVPVSFPHTPEARNHSPCLTTSLTVSTSRASTFRECAPEPLLELNSR
jgi:hypothetical protein